MVSVTMTKSSTAHNRHPGLASTAVSSKDKPVSCTVLTVAPRTQNEQYHSTAELHRGASIRF